MSDDWEDELPDTDIEDEDLIILTDDEGEDVPFRCLAQLELNGKTYAVLCDAEDENSVMIFRTEEDEDGEISYSAVEDEDECDDVFYTFEAEIDDYEFGPAE